MKKLIDCTDDELEKICDDNLQINDDNGHTYCGYSCPMYALFGSCGKEAIKALNKEVYV